ncbi:hypothetical protein ACLBWP_06645 [Microbacterium sp. M1A1_1b]|nr:hypothetical protein [Curtobacterium sp. VKM Ac-2922]
MSATPSTSTPPRVPTVRSYDETLTQPIDMAALLAEQEPFDA